MDNKDKSESTLKGWDITADRFVAYIDIMGFKDMVARTKHEDVYFKMEQLLLSKNLIQSMYSKSLDSRFSYEDNIRDFIITIYSDSIIIFSRSDDKRCFETFLEGVAAMHEGLFIDGFPHKGAIAFGKMSVDYDNSIFFGQPLIDAYQLQDELAFYGIAIHASCEWMLKYFELTSKFIVTSSCRFKQGAAMHKMLSAPEISQDIFDTWMDVLRRKTSGSLRAYIDNTEVFFKISWDNYKKYYEELEKE